MTLAAYSQFLLSKSLQSASAASSLFRGFQLARKYREFSMLDTDRYAANIALAARVKDIPGCVVECGVWRGGMIAGIAEVLGPGREYHLFDSFEGLPPAREEVDGSGAIAYQMDRESPTYYDNCRAEIGFATRAMSRSGASKVEMHRGWFSETVPGFHAKDGIALLRLDGDWYDSTIACLRALYPQVSEGGMMLIDDYHDWPGCTRAVHAYLAETKSTDRIRDSFGVTFVVKQAALAHPV